jgi:hypothetical protein
VRAAEGLIERQGKQALDVVEAALEDAEAKVRYRTLYKAIRVGVPLHGDVLRQLLSADPSPTVRFLALEALPKVPHIQPETLRESLEFALSDADEGVREQAGALLDELEPIDVLLAPEDPLQTQLQERSSARQPRPRRIRRPSVSDGPPDTLGHNPCGPSRKPSGLRKRRESNEKVLHS